MASQKAVGPYGTCIDFTQAFLRNETYEGVTVGYIPYTQCTQRCPGWRRYSTSQIVMVLSQFLLPGAIFAFLLPRTKYLVFQYRFPRRPQARGIWDKMMWALTGFLAFVVEGFVSFVVAVLDMILWIAILMTIPGPILWESVLELVFDYCLKTSLVTARNPELRLDLLLALLCGNFSYDHTTTEESRIWIEVAFHRINAQEQPRGQAAAHLIALMDSQPPFGSSVGIPTLFFLGGFLYNTLTMNDLTAAGYNWTPYAIWLMLMVYMAVASTATATGTNPSALEPLLHDVDKVRQPVIKGWRRVLRPASFYPGKLQPVNIWDRGTRKREWLLLRRLRTDRDFPQDLKCTEWLAVGFCVAVLTSFPTIMAFFMAHILPWPHFGCRSVGYLTYGAIQIVLITAVAFRSTLKSCLGGANPSRGWVSWLKRVIKSPMALALIVTVGTSLLLSFFLSFPGSIFQIFGVYNTCLCRTDPATWRLNPADRWTTLGILGDQTAAYKASSEKFALSMTWAAVATTTVICFVGWWYQKTMYAAVRKEVRRLADA